MSVEIYYYTNLGIIYISNLPFKGSFATSKKILKCVKDVFNIDHSPLDKERY